MPEFTVKAAISMSAVPEPPSAMRGQRNSPSKRLFAQLVTLPAGQALPVTVAKAKDGANLKFNLRQQAKKAGRFLSSSRTADSLTLFFWLEPKQ